jgi:Domain of unknown function (DUF932)
MQLLPQLTHEVQIRPVYISDHTLKTIGYQAVTRSDDAEVVFGIYQNYTPITNAEFQELARDLATAGGYEVAGYAEYNRGARVLAYLRNPTPGTLNGYAQNEYLTLGNSHDGSTQLFMAYTNELLRCENQFTRLAQRTSLRLNHKGDVAKKLALFREHLKLQVIENHKTQRAQQRMHQVTVTPQMTEALIKYLLKPGTDNAQADATTNGKVATLLRSAIARETQELGMTAWGLFNGVTRYTTHELTQREKTFGAVFGRAYELNNRAFDYLTTL